MKELMLTKAQFNIYKVEHYGVEENSPTTCAKLPFVILVLLATRGRTISTMPFLLWHFSQRQDRELPGAISRGLRVVHVSLGSSPPRRLSVAAPAADQSQG
jgi:hypothetical protein